IYFGDYGGREVRKLTPSGTITTVAGNGTSGFSGDGGPATEAQLSQPEGLALDAAGNLYIADALNGRIRKVTPDGTVRTVAVGFGFPIGVTLDSAGNLYVADSSYNRIWYLNQSVDLQIVKSHTGDLTLGTNGVYSLVVTNVGGAPTTGVITVSDTL